MNEENNTEKSQFWAELGEGISAMLILIGVGFCILSMGTCCALVGGYIQIGNQTEQKHDTEIQINGK